VTTHDDLAAIDAAILQRRIAHLAEQARAELAQQPAPAPDLPRAIEAPRRVAADELYALSVQPQRPLRPTVSVVGATVHPVEEERVSPPLSWLQRHWPKLALAGAAVVLALGVVWAVVALVTALVTAVVAAVTAAIPILAGAALLVLLVLLCSGGRGGGTDFSGTFQGRLHR